MILLKLDAFKKWNEHNLKLLSEHNKMNKI